MAETAETYTVVLDEGIVIRDRDGKQVAPCESDQDPDFLAYNTWANGGGQPTILQTRG